MDGAFMDLRKYNGTNNKRLKILPKVSKYLLDPKVLQRWASLGLQQRCLQLSLDLEVNIHPNTLRDFYVKHNIRNRVVGFTYQQALNRSKAPIMAFSLHLARLVQQKKSLVYFDESSFHMWMRNSKTWTPPDYSVKWAYPKFRGTGITIFGAIGTCLEKPVFMKASTTNKDSVM
jgi:hypothetical protein